MGAGGESPIPKPADRLIERVGRAVIGEDLVGELTLAIERPLGGLAGLEVRCGPTATGLQAGESNVARGIHEDDEVAQVVPAGFEQDRRVEDDRAVTALPLGAPDGLEERLPHPGVEDRFEVTTGRRVGKDPGAQRTPVDRGGTVGLGGGAEDLAAEALDDALAAGSLIQQGVANPVGVDEEGPMLLQTLRDPGFAGTDAADKSDDGQLTVFPRGGWVDPAASRAARRDRASSTGHASHDAFFGREWRRFAVSDQSEAITRGTIGR